MAVVRETVRLGLAARGQSKLKVRQPLRAAVVVAAGEERAAIERLADVALEELNVKELRYVSQADELGSYEVKPNYRALGPRFGKQMPQVAAAVASLDPEHVARALRDGGRVGISVDGHDHELDADDLMLAMQPLDGYQLEREGSHAVALELELDDELRREGLAREIVHAVQNARKARGPRRSRTGSRSTLGGDEELLAAARAYEDVPRARDARRRGRATTAQAAGRRRLQRSRAARWRSRSRASSADAASRARPLGEHGIELRLDPLLGHGALDPRGLLAVAEDQHGRDRHDPVGGGRLLVVVDVDLDDPQVLALGGDLLEHRGSRRGTARTRGPRSPPAPGSRTR